MEDPLNQPKSYTDVGCILRGATKEELVQKLIENDQEAAIRVDQDGTISFDFLDESMCPPVKRGEVGHNSPYINDIPITFQDGDKVTTRDGREGIVLESVWFPSNVLYRYNDEPRMGYYYIKVDFGDHYEYHLRLDLTGNRFRKL